MSRLRILSTLILLSINTYSQTNQQNWSKFEVNEISIDELNDIIKIRNGRVLLINIWATWCVPCKEEFPDLIKISDKYGEKLDLVGISIDYPDEIDSKILPFLNELQPSFINYVNGESDSEKFINNLDPKWSGAIPATFLYDSEAEQISFFIGNLSFEEIENKALKLIK